MTALTSPLVTCTLAGVYRLAFTTGLTEGDTLAFVVSPAALAAGTTYSQFIATQGFQYAYLYDVATTGFQVFGPPLPFPAGTYYIYYADYYAEDTDLLHAAGSVVLANVPATVTPLSEGSYAYEDVPADIVVRLPALGGTSYTVVAERLDGAFTLTGVDATVMDAAAFTAAQVTPVWSLDGVSLGVGVDQCRCEPSAVFGASVTLGAPRATTLTSKISVWKDGVFAGVYSQLFDSHHDAIPSYAVPTDLAIKLNRATNEILGRNVLLVTNPLQSDAVALALKYQATRAIPDANVLSLALTATMTDTATQAQVQTFLSAIVAKINTVPTPIRAICLVGDFASFITGGWGGINNYGAGLTMTVPQLLWNARFWAANGPYNPTTHGDWLTLAAQLRALFWVDGANSPYCFSDPGTELNPYLTPSIADNGAYVVYSLPLSPFADGLAVAMQRLDDAIACEKAGHTDWGTVLLREGGSNTTVQPFVEEARFAANSKTLPNMHWTGCAAQNRGIADNDANGWAGLMPGDTGFDTGNGHGKPIDVFMASFGTNEYYNAPHDKVEQPGHIYYRRGALRFCGQSYGHWPDAVDFIDTYAASPTIQALTATSIYGGEDHPTALKALSLRGVYIPLLRFKWGVNGGGNTGATVEASGSPLSIIGKVGGVTKWTVTTSGKTLETIKTDLYAAINTANAAGGSWFMDVGNSPAQMSRALAAFRAGAAITAGVLVEPHGVGDIDCFGLYSTLWAGGSVAEWASRVMAGTSPYTPQPWAWMFLGDILMAPFRQSRYPGAVRLF